MAREEVLFCRGRGSGARRLDYLDEKARSWIETKSRDEGRPCSPAGAGVNRVVEHQRRQALPCPVGAGPGPMSTKPPCPRQQDMALLTGRLTLRDPLLDPCLSFQLRSLSRSGLSGLRCELMSASCSPFARNQMTAGASACLLAFLACRRATATPYSDALAQPLASPSWPCV